MPANRVTRPGRTSGPGLRVAALAGPLSFALVALTGSALIAWKVVLAVRVGPEWDTFAFLSNAAEFAGQGYGYAELHRAPLISLLTATAFRLGAPMHESVIQWVDGAVSLLGIIAFYLLARRRLTAPLAAAATLGLFAVQPLWLYLGSGYTDFPSVALSLWFVLAMVSATEKSPTYYLVAGLLLVAAVLMRYTALLVVFPGLLWFAMRASLFRHAKAVLGAAVAGIAAYLPMGRFYAEHFGDGLFPFVVALSASETVTAPGGEGSVEAAGSYYIAHAPAFLAGEGFAVLGWLALAGAVLGLTLGTAASLTAAKPSWRRSAAAAAGVALALLGQTGGLFARQFTLPVAVYLVWRAFAPREHDGGRDGRDGRVQATAALDAVMLLWFLTYFDFHGHQAIQVPRYVITMAPPLLYFLAIGWWQAAADVGRTLGATDASRPRVGRVTASQLAAAMGLGLIVALAVTSTLATTRVKPDPLVAAARGSARWLVKNAKGLDSPPLYSDVWPMTAWYARIQVRPMPFFQDPRAYAHELAKGRANYFVTIAPKRFDDFEVAHDVGPVAVLERSAPARHVLPRVAYVGKSWDNYLETVTDFGFFLTGDAGRYGWEGTAFLDGLSAAELARYEAVAVFGVRWRDRATGEAALARYLRDGGSVVIDASGNLGELPYELGDTVMFDTVIKRGLVPDGSVVAVKPGFAAAHPDIGEIAATPFVNEDGGGWYGAEYSALPGTAPLEVLATVNGRPAVSVRSVGRGRVYWIGYNMVWHAFHSDNEGESRLVRAVFDDAITHSRETRAENAAR